MTVLLVLITLIAFLVADYFVQRSRQKELSIVTIRTTQRFLPDQLHFGEDLALAPNHMWMRREHDESITVGVDNFLLGLTGAPGAIVLPREGDMVGRGVHAVELKARDKSLRIHCPIEGQVLETNTAVAEQPALASGNPYTTGWLFRLAPFDSAISLSGFLHGNDAVSWLKKQGELVKEFLSARVPHVQFATMQDGGVPADGVLKGFNPEVWNEFQQQFVSLPSRSERVGEYDNA